MGKSFPFVETHIYLFPNRGEAWSLTDDPGHYWDNQRGHVDTHAHNQKDEEKELKRKNGFWLSLLHILGNECWKTSRCVDRYRTDTHTQQIDQVTGKCLTWQLRLINHSRCCSNSLNTQLTFGFTLRTATPGTTPMSKSLVTTHQLTCRLWVKPMHLKTIRVNSKTFNTHDLICVLKSSTYIYSECLNKAGIVVALSLSFFFISPTKRSLLIVESGFIEWNLLSLCWLFKTNKISALKCSHLIASKMQRSSGKMSWG